MNAEFFEAVRPLFGGALSQAQVDGFKIIFEAWRKVGSGNERDLAYILATAYHETARTMQPVRETLATTDAKAKERLTKAWKSGKLPWVKSDYWSGGWFGRGFVQLTHRANYVKAGEKLGVDLVSDPSKAMIPEVSALILVRGMQEGWFTGMKLSDASDFREARRVVNGTDRASQIAMYADAFLSALDAMDDAFISDRASIDVQRGATGNKGGWLVLAALAIAGVVVGAYNWIASLFG
jgi:putative chitinase